VSHAPADRECRIHQVLRGALAVGALLSAVVCYRMWTKQFVVGSEAGGWVHPYLADFPRYSVRALLRALSVGAVMTTMPLALVKRFQWIVVLVWVGAAFFIQSELRSQTRYSLAQMFVSDGANGFYNPALRYPASAFLSNPESIRDQLPSHSRTNMPGKQMLVSGMTAILRDPAAMAWVTIAISNAGALLMFLFVRELLADPVAAVLAAAFYLFVPSKLYFFPVMNTVTPTLTLLFAVLWQRWARTGSVVYAAAMGAAFYVLVFFEPLPLVMGLLFLIMMLSLRWPAGMTAAGFAAHAAVAAGVALTVDAAMYAVFRFELLQAFQYAMNDAVAFNQRASRPYAVWVGRNLVDMAFGMGLAQTAVLLATLALAAWARMRNETIVVFSVALAAVVLATDLLGVNRGEVVRLWIFLGCFAQIPAGAACARLNSRTAVAVVLLTSLLQGALGTVMMGFATP